MVSKVFPNGGAHGPDRDLSGPFDVLVRVTPLGIGDRDSSLLESLAGRVTEARLVHCSAI